MQNAKHTPGDDLEDHYRILALKKAFLVMDTLANSLKDESAKQEIKSLAWTISWAIVKLEEPKATQA